MKTTIGWISAAVQARGTSARGPPPDAADGPGRPR